MRICYHAYMRTSTFHTIPYHTISNQTKPNLSSLKACVVQGAEGRPCIRSGVRGGLGLGGKILFPLPLLQVELRLCS